MKGSTIKMGHDQTIPWQYLLRKGKLVQAEDGRSQLSYERSYWQTPYFSLYTLHLPILFTCYVYCIHVIWKKYIIHGYIIHTYIHIQVHDKFKSTSAFLRRRLCLHTLTEFNCSWGFNSVSQSRSVATQHLRSSATRRWTPRIWCLQTSGWASGNFSNLGMLGANLNNLREYV